MSYEKYLGNDTPIPEGELRVVYRELAAFLNQNVHLQRDPDHKKLMDRILVQAYKGTSRVLPAPSIPTVPASSKPASGVDPSKPSAPLFGADSDPTPLGSSKPRGQTYTPTVELSAMLKPPGLSDTPTDEYESLIPNRASLSVAHALLNSSR